MSRQNVHLSKILMVWGFWQLLENFLKLYEAIITNELQRVLTKEVSKQ